ncbi:hypothetical protein RRG08_021796 [Elysia crispata]|uniref:Secreted protein n=1 Tax=Elysia crispata TaxID=231223 RepID=A0AAE0ZY98_9GAST|nr:hypothetical protein RRG08_021796 [Elysia crispata]
MARRNTRARSILFCFALRTIVSVSEQSAGLRCVTQRAILMPRLIGLERHFMGTGSPGFGGSCFLIESRQPSGRGDVTGIYVALGVRHVFSASSRAAAPHRVRQ